MMKYTLFILINKKGQVYFMKVIKTDTIKDPNKFCIDDVLDYVKSKYKKSKKKKAKKSK